MPFAVRISGPGPHAAYWPSLSALPTHRVPAATWTAESPDERPRGLDPRAEAMPDEPAVPLHGVLGAVLAEGVGRRCCLQRELAGVILLAGAVRGIKDRGHGAHRPRTGKRHTCVGPSCSETARAAASHHTSLTQSDPRRESRRLTGGLGGQLRTARDRETRWDAGAGERVSGFGSAPACGAARPPSASAGAACPETGWC